MIFIFALLICKDIYAQPDSVYKNFAAKANACFSAKDYENAVRYYSRAFHSIGDKGFSGDRYKAAIAYSELNIPDSAFKNLTRLAEKTTILECESLETQKEFEKLKKDPRWKYVKDLTCGTNRELNNLFVSIHKTDQGYRQQVDSIGTTFGFRSNEMQSLWKKINYYDSLNLVRIDSIYSIYGWPDPRIAGKKCGRIFWLVVQHSPLHVQEKYLPIMQKAVNEGKANAGDLAYLEDRILMFKGQPQKYGSQFTVKENGSTCLYKLESKEKVNVWRKEVGLSPLDQALLDGQMCD